MTKWSSNRRSPPIRYERTRKSYENLLVLDRRVIQSAGKELLVTCAELLAQIRPQGGNTTITAEEGEQFLRVTLTVLRNHLGSNWVRKHLVEHWLSAPLVNLVGQFANEEWVDRYCGEVVAVLMGNTREPPKSRGEEAVYDHRRTGCECA